MGFNKKFLSESSIKSKLKVGYDLDKIFNADLLIFTDDYSYNLYEQYKTDKGWITTKN
jgi:hypothetical protein